jgi:PadR family transcriptional regulator, regulatory protein PadR
MGDTNSADQELKKGSAEVLIMALVEERPRHGYEIASVISERSGGVLNFHVTTLYPLLHRMERRGWVKGRWVEKAGQRRRRYYRLTAEGREVLGAQRRNWQEFFAALDSVARITPA